MVSVMDVSLIIKSPSQHINDLKVQCKLNWSIKDVKDHISIVYPTKPKIEHQKLIYCGRLLPNHLKLKDMLPNENELTHIFHLVCNVPVASSDISDTSGKKLNPTAQSQPTSSTNNSNVQASVTDINFQDLHQRRNIDGHLDRTQMYSMINSNLTNANMPQMAAMQQAYAHFLNQYMLYVQSNRLQTIPNITSVSNNQPVNTDIRNDVSAVDAGNRADDQNNPANAPVPAADDGNEVHPNRDFLDMVYIFARITLLIAMLGFYSSLRRILLVAGITLFIHLLHKRTQRRRNDNAHEQRPQEISMPNENSTGDQQPETPEEQAAGNVNQEPESSVLETERSTETSSLALIRTFIIGFFSSLIPESPVPVQVN